MICIPHDSSPLEKVTVWHIFYASPASALLAGNRNLGGHSFHLSCVPGHIGQVTRKGRASIIPLLMFDQEGFSSFLKHMHKMNKCQ